MTVFIVTALILIDLALAYAVIQAVRKKHRAFDLADDLARWEEEGGRALAPVAATSSSVRMRRSEV